MSIAEQPQIRNRKRQSHRPPAGIFHAIEMDPEQQTRLELLICDRWLERVYAGERVDIRVMAQDGARGRMAAYLQPWYLAKLIMDRVLYKQPVNLPAIRENYPDAYAGYSAKLDGMLRLRAWQAEQGHKAVHTAFARTEVMSCDELS